MEDPMGLKIGEAHAPGATPMDPDERDGLVPKHIVLKRELDEFEQINILEGQAWAERNKNFRKNLLSDENARKLHQKMFGKTWKWAGTFRRTEKSIGVDPVKIGVMLHDLLEDVKAWQEFKTYPVDEQAVRLHHRMVLIHPFPNGNGRHARLFTDAFLRSCDAEPFSWGRINLVDPSETRTAYISALQAADAKDYGPLLAFVHT